MDAYKGLLRVEAEKRLDLVRMITNFKGELAVCKEQLSKDSVSPPLHDMAFSYAE